MGTTALCYKLVVKIKYLDKSSMPHLCASTEDRSRHVLPNDKLTLELKLLQNLANELHYESVAIFHDTDYKIWILLSVAAHQHHQRHQLRSLKKIWGSNKNLLRPLVALAFFVYYGKTI
jgi:hypothetical protein